MGRLAAEILLGRISDKSREYRTSYVQTDLILRESTGSKTE
jgi:DNA-binding LacI/PurR family transcriptional regulator